MDQPVDPNPARRRGLWGALGSLVRAPAAAFGAKDVAQGARTVVRLANAVAGAFTKVPSAPHRPRRRGESRSTG